jgi:hypothetical protein
LASTKQERPVRQISSTIQSTHQARDHSAAVTDDQYALMRGVVHGVILSMILWTAALYLTLALR